MESPPNEITNEDSDRYQIRDIQLASPSRFPRLHAALSTRLRKFTVEFLFADGDKPNVRFKFNFERYDNGNADPDFASVVVAMELGEVQDPAVGTLLIKLRQYIGPTRTARAAFEFDLTSLCTLEDVLEVIQGIHPDLPDHFRSDLSHFRFVVVPDTQGNYDGCRDWV